MKLAEALSLRADLQTRVNQLQSRLKAVAKVQEGDVPPEDPMLLLNEIESCLAQLEQLIVRINKTNQEAITADGKTLTQKIAERDILTKHNSIYQDLLDYLLQRTDRYTRTEIKFVNTVDAAMIRKKADETAKRLREVDVEIQSANWTFDLSD